MIYRKATINDISQLVKIRLAYLRADYGFLSEEQTKEISYSLPIYFEKHLGKDILIYIAMDGTELISSAFLLITEKPSNPSFITGRTGSILNVYTDPKYRRQGIANNLLKILLEDARQLALDFVELKSTKMGKSLYESIGFKIEECEYTPMKYKF